MKIRHRIAFQQARIILLSSFLIGGLSALIQFYIDLSHVRGTLVEKIERSIAIYEPNIHQAVYSLDTDLANNISKILAKDPLFTSAIIYDDFGTQMAATPPPEERPLSWLDNLSFRLLDVPKSYVREIEIDPKSGTKARLTVTLNKYFASQGLSKRAITLGISGFISTIVLSVVLFLVFYSALSIPIQRISQWVAQLDHWEPDTNLPYSKQNELGDLTHNVHDIWRKKDEANKQVMTLAYYDPLTKLANRRMFTETLDNALDNAGSPDMGAVMYLDIDRFKTINDSLGHHIGDHLLVTVAERLSKLLPRNAMAARFGGDEFVLLLPDLSRHSEVAAGRAIELADRILASIAEPTQIGRNSIHCSTSIGITVYPQNPDTSSNILRRADTALYRVKAEGRNGYQFYDEGMQLHAKARWEIEEGLHKAIGNGELELWMQPQVTSRGQISGAEVLLRWNHPTKGMISPLDFVSVAEESGQISPIEEWVLSESLRLLSRWKNTTGLPETFKRLSINISPAHFMQADFVKRTLPLLEYFQLQDITIEFEITENLLIDNFEHASETMYTLQKHGISFAIDDFGTGYSSLRYLSQLPLNILKIDRSFITHLEQNKDDAAIVDVILLTAKKLGLEVIAEGVETAAQQQSLAQRGCHLYQGFYFSKPLHHVHFHQLLQQASKQSG